MSFDLAVLDMAGTTVDEGGLVYEVLDATVADAAGTPVPADLLAHWKGTSKREAIEGLLTGLRDRGWATDVSAETVDKIHDDFAARLLAAYRSTPPRPLPGVPEALARLRARGVKVALQTGYAADVASAILDGLGWTVGPSADDTVDALVTSDQVAASRPAPYLVFRCMEATGVVDVRRVLVAGDTPNDLGAGTNAGAGMVVGVLTGSFGVAELGRVRHTHLMASVAELPSLL